MKELRELQLELKSLITAENPPSGRDLGRVEDAPPLSREARLRIYRTAWWLRLSESLAEDFPELARRLGTKAFDRLARAYLDACPPSSYTLAHAGDRLPDFLSRRWRDPARRAWHAELARAEQALYSVLRAADPAPWDLAALSALAGHDPGGRGATRLKLRLQPCARLIHARWQVDKALEGRSRPPARGERFLVVYRDGFSPRWLRLTRAQHGLLSMAARGASLDQWSRRAGNAPWIEWLGDWARAGIIRPESSHPHSLSLDRPGTPPAVAR